MRSPPAASLGAVAAWAALAREGEREREGREKEEEVEEEEADWSSAWGWMTMLTGRASMAAVLMPWAKRPTQAATRPCVLLLLLLLLLLSSSVVFMAVVVVVARGCWRVEEEGEEGSEEGMTNAGSRLGRQKEMLR